MSKTAADPDLDLAAKDDVESGDNSESDAEAPDVEEDLFEEELRIDGICGVY